jgi:hypothetical protein
MADMPDTNSTSKNGPIPIDLKEELDRLRSYVKQLTEENDRLKDKLEHVQTERDDFLRALRYYDPDQFFTAEDLAEFRKNAISGRQMLEELEAMMRESQ